MVSKNHSKNAQSKGFNVFSIDKKSNRLIPKRKRSCLQCQRRKAKCLTVENSSCEASSCKLCLERDVACSFARNSPESADSANTLSGIEDPARTTTYEHQQIPFLDQLNNLDWIKLIDSEIADNNMTFDILSINKSPGVVPASYTDSASNNQSDLEIQDATEVPIDGRNVNTSFQYYGYTGEYDPWLRYNFYQYDKNNECAFSSKFFRKMGTANDPVIFAFKDKDRLLQETKEIENGVSQYDAKISERLVNYAPNFIILYLKFVFPSLPILDGKFLHDVFSNEMAEYSKNSEDIDPLLLILIAKVVRRWDTYDTSIEIFSDDSEILMNDRKKFMSTAWNMLIDEIHTPDLSTVKSLILFYHLLGLKKDSQINGFEQSVLSSLITVCYRLGLHEDCSTWNIPEMEKMTRQRLWWTVYILEKWGSFVSGSPSLINDEEIHIIPPASFEDIFEDTFEYMNNDENFVKSFHLSIKLTLILIDVKRSLFSQSSYNSDKSSQLDKCEELETKLTNWKSELLDIQASDSISTHSLMISCFVLEITIFRARFRILGTPEYYNVFFSDASKKLQEIVDYLTSLPSLSIHGFWYRWTRSGFMYIKDFVLSLIVISRTKEQSLMVLNLTRRFREWLELNSKTLPILWTTLLRLNIATQSIGNQFKAMSKRGH